MSLLGHTQGRSGRGHKHGQKRGTDTRGPEEVLSFIEAKRGVPHRCHIRGFHLTSVEDDVTKRGDKRGGVCVQGHQKMFHTRPPSKMSYIKKVRYITPWKMSYFNKVTYSTLEMSYVTKVTYGTP